MNSVCYHTAVMLADRIGIPQLRDMAGRSERVVADIALADLERIAELLSDSFVADERRLRVEATFGDNGQGFPEVECRVTGQLPLVCQRCLGNVEWQLEVDFRLAVVSRESDLDKVVEKFDAVVADESGFNLRDAISDEILSALPLAPMHESVDDCVGVQQYMTGEPDVRESEQEKVNRPFADLGNLLGRDRPSE